MGFVEDPRTSMVLQWRTEDDNTLSSIVQYGTDGNLDHEVEGFTFFYISGFSQNGSFIRMHETHLCGLAPGTDYTYRVGGRDEIAEAE